MAQSIKLARRPMTAISTASTVSSTVSRTAIASTLVTSNSRQTSSLHTTSRRNPRLCCQRQCSASPSPRRAYHSRHHPPFPPHYTYPDSPSANSILTAALTHVPRHGFTNEALTLGARDAGYLDVSVQLFPRGAFEIILFYLASRRELLKERAEKGEIFGGVANGAESLSVEEKVKMLVMERLRMNEEIIDQWQDVRIFPISFPVASLMLMLLYLGPCSNVSPNTRSRLPFRTPLLILRHPHPRI